MDARARVSPHRRSRLDSRQNARASQILTRGGYRAVVLSGSIPLQLRQSTQGIRASKPMADARSEVNHVSSARTGKNISLLFRRRPLAQ